MKAEERSRVAEALDQAAQVLARAPAKLRYAPLRFNPALMLQTVQRGVQGALVDLKHILGDLLNPLGNCPAVAGGGVMLSADIDRYIALRQALGFGLRDTQRHLRAFARFAAAKGDTHIRTSTAVAWATEAP